jgi:ABC-type branched-subunit amino acid transport system substrate-binding protein
VAVILPFSFYSNIYGQAKKPPIKMNVLSDRTGGIVAYGYSHGKVIKAAAKRINKTGGIVGRHILLLHLQGERNI